MNYTALCEEARACGCTVTRQAPLAGATTFRIGGPADVLIDLPDGEAAARVMAVCIREQIPRLFIGKGSNLLVGDKGFRGAVLRFDGQKARPRLMDGGIEVPAGLSLAKACLFAKDQGLAGLEFAYGIPGSVGGAVYMNAGAYGGQMADVLREADVLFPDGRVCTLPVEQLSMSYRHTRLMEEDGIVLSARLALTPDDPAVIEERMKAILSRRQEKQPLEYPSAGSFFKRPAGYFAGALIEEAGLKGYTVGGAQISEKHAGFVINRGGATAADIRQLCRDVQKIIREKNAVDLEPEVRFVGDF